MSGGCLQGTAAVYHRPAESAAAVPLCAKVCPAGAITGTVKEPHVIDSGKCLKCGACMEKCRFGAIVRK